MLLRSTLKIQLTCSKVDVIIADSFKNRTSPASENLALSACLCVSYNLGCADTPAARSPGFFIPPPLLPTPLLPAPSEVSCHYTEEVFHF